MNDKNFDEFGLDEDDSSAPATRSGLPSIYSALRTELEKPVNLEEDFLYTVRGRDLKLRISADLPLKKLNRWRTAATNRKTGFIDQIHFSTLLISGQVKCLVINGEDAIQDGEWLNFSHKDVIESLDALDRQGAIERFFARDSEIIRCGNEILEKSGYGDDEDFTVDDEDEDNDPLV